MRHLFCLLLALITAIAPSAEWAPDELGRTTITTMQSAPYPHPSRAEGFKGRNGTVWPADIHYTNSDVAFFVPSSYKPGPTTDLVIYFHGHGNDVRKALRDFKLREQLVASGRNAILLFPQGPFNASDSGLGKLEDPDGLKKLVEEALALLKADGVIPEAALGSVVLTGHSGAYRGIGECLRHGGIDEHIREVYLLDATYGQLEIFADWIARHPNARFGSIFTEHLADENVILMAALSKANVPFTLRVDDNMEPNAESARVFFLHTLALDHNGAVTWLERFLKSPQ